MPENTKNNINIKEISEHQKNYMLYPNHQTNFHPYLSQLLSDYISKSQESSLTLNNQQLLSVNIPTFNEEYDIKLLMNQPEPNNIIINTIQYNNVESNKQDIIQDEYYILRLRPNLKPQIIISNQLNSGYGINQYKLLSQAVNKKIALKLEFYQTAILDITKGISNEYFLLRLRNQQSAQIALLNTIYY